MKTSFDDLKICPEIVAGLKKQQITQPTPIQSLTYSAFLEGKNLIVESHTGSGKTLAFLLPLFKKIDLSLKANQAIILAPTHELALQINEQVKLLAKNSGVSIRSALIMGEVNIDHQIKRLKEKPEIIIGSPGRILDLITKKKISKTTIQTVVLDEADNLLLHNQGSTVKKLLYQLNASCQIALFSASMGHHIDVLSLPLLENPEIIRTSKQTALNPLIEHYYIKTSQRDKFETLKKILQSAKSSKVLVFVSQHTDTSILCEKLTYHGFTIDFLSGKQSKEERKKALTAFKTGKINILLSSDLSARGLDVPSISHIIHYDLPLTAEDYLHRSGRTARTGNRGISISIMTPKELGMIRILERSYSIALKEVTATKGKLLCIETGEEVVGESVASAAPATKNRNKYPKGFTKKAAPTKPKKIMQPVEELSDEPGTLADALKLIEQSYFED